MQLEALFTRHDVDSPPKRETGTKLDYSALFRRSRPTLNLLTSLILEDEKNAQAVTQLCLKRASSLVTTFMNEGELCCWLLRAVIDEALVHRHKKQKAMDRLLTMGRAG